MEFNFNDMKKILSSLLVLVLATSSFAQKIDFINAPLNPVPDISSVAQQNLKGDVFQADFTKFTRDGEQFLSDEKKKKKDVIEFDAKNRIAKVTTSYQSITNYTYDQKSRVIKEVYQHLYENWTIDYTYKQIKDVLMVTQKKVGDKQSYDIERHFKNGLEIQFQHKGKSPRKYHYEFDKKGNWIKRLTHDITSKTLIYEVNTRNIIYYDEYDQGINAISVVSKKFVEVLIVPNTFINNKKYHMEFSRFDNDYVFYDALSKTYYIARGGYNKNNIEGQKHAVEKLSSGYETALLYNGKTATIVESGKARQSFNDWKTANYLGFMIAADSVANKSYAFGPFPAVSDNKIIALGGKDMMDEENKVSYLLNHEKKAFFVFENGKNIVFNYVAVREGDLSIILGDRNAPKFVTPSDKKRVENAITPGRYFDPARDKILTKNATSTANPQTSVKASTTALPPANNSSGSSNRLSTDSKNYLSVYRNNPQGVKEHLAALYNVMLQKKYPPTMISGLFAIMAKEVFPTNEDAAFDLLMKMPNGVVVRDVLSNLPKEMRDVIGKRARAKVATYAK